tara:strand:- start:35 stop:1240 length:1206 start_codon:yes stop_codon:yes gene_type:complete
MNDVLNAPDFIKLSKELSKPNIFNVLSLEHYEIRHSNFLGWLINPNESHKLNKEHCKNLINVLFPNFNGDYLNPTVHREKYNIDLLIESNNEILVLENKIYAKDHVNQLNTYRQKIMNNDGYKDKHFHFTYLTPKGVNPTDTNEINYWNNSSYEEIIVFLRKLLKESEMISRTRFYIEDYLRSLELYILKNNSLNILAKKITADFKKNIYELLSSNNLENHSFDTIRALKFIKTNSSFEKGKGFFRTESRFSNAFTTALKEISCTPLKTGKNQSTYLRFNPNVFEILGIGVDDIPFSFSFRFFDNKQKLFLYGTVLPENISNIKYRNKIINQRDIFAKLLKDNFVLRPGKKHVGIYSKSISFNPLDFNEINIDKEIKSIIIKNFNEDISLISDRLVRLLQN